MDEHSSTKFVGFGIKLALFLGAAGLLPWATLFMAKLALEESSRGLLSIGKWNRRLLHAAPTHHHHKNSSHTITTHHKNN